MRTRRSRRGVALFAALGVVTLLALLIAGTVAAATIAQRSSQISHADALLDAAADFALTTVLASADSLALSDMPLGVPRTFTIELPPSQWGIAASAAATRLPHDVLWLVSSAELTGRDRGRRRLNLIARWQTLMFLPEAPILSRGVVRLHGDVTFIRDDIGEADCSFPARADVITPTTELLVSNDSVNAATDARAADSTSYLLAPTQRAALENARRVVHVRGDTTIATGAFEGILIVDGSLLLDGPFTISGLVIARTITATRGGLVVRGALLSFATPADALVSIELANASLQFDPCLVSRVLRRAASSRAVHERSWSEIF